MQPIDQAHEILLRRRTSVFVDEGGHNAPAHHMHTVQLNLKRLGYVASSTLAARLMTLDATALNAFIERTI
ncbi:MAG: N-formylglutamate amidohydrolase, partial [Kiritimatiellia bacterium]